MTPPPPVPLTYADPRLGRRRHRAKHLIAIGFGAVAVPLGGLFAFAAFVQWDYPSHTSAGTSADTRVYHANAVKLACCAALLVGPGVRYFRLGVRGQPAMETTVR